MIGSLTCVGDVFACVYIRGDLGLLSHLKDVMDIPMRVLDSSNPYPLQAEGHTHSCLWQRGGGGGFCSERLLLAEEKGSSVIVMGVCTW